MHSRTSCLNVHVNLSQCSRVWEWTRAETPPGSRGISQEIHLSPFITFWYPATVHRWRYLPGIVSHLPALPVNPALRLYADRAPRDGQRNLFSPANSSAPHALRSSQSSWSLAIRREHILPINNDLNVFNKRLHTTSTPWLPYHQPHPSLLS